MVTPSAHRIAVSAGPATCRCPPAADRSSAAHLLVGRIPFADIIRLPDCTSVQFPGRVCGLGRFRNDALRSLLAEALPPEVRGSLRPDFEWYACRGAFFHNDAHYGGVLFGAWCVAGPRREIVFSRLGVRTPAAPGDWTVFDPFEPHAALDCGTVEFRRDRYEGAPVSLFIGFELELDEAVSRSFGIAPPVPGATILSSAVKIDAENGRLPPPPGEARSPSATAGGADRRRSAPVPGCA